MTALEPRWPFTAEELRALGVVQDALVRVGKTPLSRQWSAPELHRAYEAIALVLTFMGHVWPEGKLLPAMGEDELDQEIADLADKIQAWMDYAPRVLAMQRRVSELRRERANRPGGRSS